MAKEVVRRYTITVADGQEGSDDRPSVGPSYKSVYSADLPAPPDNVQTCWDVFRCSKLDDLLSIFFSSLL